MDIRAIMPGKIISINAEVGDAVKTNDVLGFMEAMKMELPISCPGDGTVRDINVAVGDVVTSEQILFSVE